MIRRKGGAVPGGQGTAARLPARSGPRSYKDRPCKRNAGQRPRWTDAGRGLWPPAGHGAAWRSGKGNRLCHGSGVRPFAPVSGRGKRDPRFPRPRTTGPQRPVQPAPTTGPVPRGSVALWQGDGPCQDAQGARRRKRFPLCDPAAPAAGTFQHPANAVSSWQNALGGAAPRGRAPLGPRAPGVPLRVALFSGEDARTACKPGSVRGPKPPG